MSEFNVRLATKGELRSISDWFLDERGKYPGMSHLQAGGLRGWMLRSIATPRYLRRAATTLVLEQDGQMAGFAVVEQGGKAVYLSDFAIREGMDRAGLMVAMLAFIENFARERDYAFVRATPWDASEASLASFYQAGFELLDYYLWIFYGQPRAVEAPQDAKLVDLSAKQALDRRLDFLRQELDASQVAGRDLIEAVFFPRRASTYRAFEITLVDPEGGEAKKIGYLSPRPNERDDGVLTIALSLAPEYWGSEMETQIVGAYAAEASPDQPVRVLISTSKHVDKAEAAFGSLGLVRELDLRPVLFKRLSEAPVASS